MAVQDDLATLFARNLTLSQPPPAEDPERIVYITQHYNHSAHLAAAQPGQPVPMQRASSEPDLADLEHTLRSHGVDTSALSRPQVELFRRADDAQRARLVQLWTICPPATAHHGPDNHHHHPGLAWSATSVEQEEMLARRRWESAQQPQHQQPHRPSSSSSPAPPATEVVMSLDGTETETASSLSGSPSSVQSPDGRWPAAHAHTYMEPYMQGGYGEPTPGGYDAASRKAALDPVYKATGGTLDWERQQWMENQYGSFVGGWRDDEDML